MAATRLPMRRLREILRLKHACGLSHRAIARACGVGAGTVSEYLSRARDAKRGRQGAEDRHRCAQHSS